MLLKDLSRESFPRTWKVLDQALTQRVAPGFVVGIWSRSAGREEAWVGACGVRRFSSSETDQSRFAMSVDTTFDLASVSKVFATASLCAALVDRGWLRWELPLRALVPEFRDSRVLLAHLLSHTAGLPAWRPLWEELRAKLSVRSGAELAKIPVALRQRAMRRLVVAVEPEAQPGERAVYSDISFLLLGFALEEAVKMPLDRAVSELLWKPMGIRGAYYRRTDSRVLKEPVHEEVAATEDDPWRGGVLQGQVHDENCWSMGGYGGHAGAFGRAQDVLRLASRWMTGYFSERVTREAWSRDRTLGWDMPSGPTPSAGSRFSASSVGHLGYTGTSLWLDPPAGVAVTILSNRVHPTRANSGIRAFRPEIHDAIRDDLSVRSSVVR